jgi:hypothetical protein
MERELLKWIVTLAREIVQRGAKRCTYDDVAIVRVHYWSVLCDRPILWACHRKNWPIWERRNPLPSQSTMSVRLRSPSVRALLDELERRVVRSAEPAGWVWCIDGKPLPIGGCSKDRQAGYGRAAGCKAKGYKLHAVVGMQGVPVAWRVAPMNKDERVMGARLLRDVAVQGYVLGDGHYDSNPLHDVCMAHGDLQLVTPPRYRKRKGLGHHRHSPARLRSLAMWDDPVSPFGRELLEERTRIERYFGRLTSFGGGLTHLPPWVRTHPRVRRWVQAKLVLQLLRRRRLATTTYGDG